MAGGLRSVVDTPREYGLAGGRPPNYSRSGVPYWFHPERQPRPFLYSGQYHELDPDAEAAARENADFNSAFVEADFADMFERAARGELPALPPAGNHVTAAQTQTIVT